jgi:hypothetical protein
MKTLGEPRTHFWLVQGMAHRLGADLPDAFASGALGTDEWSEMITRCRGCSQPGACREWLDKTESADAAPAYCRNSERLLELSED